MLTVNQLIAEIETDLSTYAESGDIDKSSLVRWITNELKRFGNNILTLHERVVDVKNSAYTFEEGFKSVRLALKVDPIGSIKEDGCTNDCLRESFVSNTRIIHGAYFNDVTLDYVKTCDSKIVEEVITLKTGKATICYTPQWLTIVKGIKRDGIASDCLNVSKGIRRTSPFEMSVTGNTLNFNFSQGLIYVQYYGLETDDEGDIIIPDDGLGHIENYLENFCKYKLAINLTANNKNPQALAQLIPLYKQEADRLFGLAMTSSKFKALRDSNWVSKARIQNRAQFNRFQLPVV